MFITEQFIIDPFVTDHVDNGPLHIAVWTLKVQTILPNTLCPVRP